MSKQFVVTTGYMCIVHKLKTPFHLKMVTQNISIIGYTTDVMVTSEIIPPQNQDNIPR